MSTYNMILDSLFYQFLHNNLRDRRNGGLTTGDHTFGTLTKGQNHKRSCKPTASTEHAGRVKDRNLTRKMKMEECNYMILRDTA